jgi:hypothetical protein
MRKCLTQSRSVGGLNVIVEALDEKKRKIQILNMAYLTLVL